MPEQWAAARATLLAGQLTVPALLLAFTRYIEEHESEPENATEIRAEAARLLRNRT